MLDKLIAHHAVPSENLPRKSGDQVFKEIGNRQLLRYVDIYHVHEPETGRDNLPTWVTPTPLSCDDLDHYLDLPSPDIPRTHVVRIDPRYIDEIRGPQWVGLGLGIQYLLPRGYPLDAVLAPHWAHEVR
ncbi:hypothetical protein [Amycolatopsis sp. MJM2582]|uniref:hypothetical protein n=1 Tax=Amycolatopsis sp. MJM2582 TaxID=1427749 RepID=UPI001269EF4A|nr:hypothetical protein [Amycolatopsis sp. MJM2582]